MGDNHDEDGVTVQGENGGFSVAFPVRGGADAEDAGYSVHQADPLVSNNENKSNFAHEEHYNGSLVEDGGRDDMFVDCLDEIETSSQQTDEDYPPIFQDDESKDQVKQPHLVNGVEQLADNRDKTLEEKERSINDYEEEKRVLMTELQSVLQTKDQEIHSLHAKLADTSRIEEVVNKMLTSISMVYHREGAEGTLTEKIESMEKSIAFLVEGYLAFASETEQLRRCLIEFGLISSIMNEWETFAIARDLILESRTKEENLHASINNLQDDRSKLVQELDNHRSLLENLKVDIQRLTAEVEHEKSRYANTKERLSMAVTKGKALVQQRDSLKQLLSEKTEELEKFSLELQDKSTALQAAEKTKELLEAIEKSSFSMQESLSEKELIIKKCREILSESEASEELQPEQISEKLRLVVYENRSLRTVYHKLDDAISSLNFPESVASSELDNRIRWLIESLHHSKQESVRLHSELAKTKEFVDFNISNLIVLFVAQTLDSYCLEVEGNELREEYENNERLRHEIAEARESLNIEIDQLRASCSVDSQEKSDLLVELENLRQEYEGVIAKERKQHHDEVDHLKALLSVDSHEKTCLQLETENLRQQFEGVVERERLIAMDKDKLLTWLLEASGNVDHGGDETHPEPADMKTIFDNCLAKIQENNKLSSSSQYDETSEILQSLLYVTCQGMSLYELVVEENLLDRERVDRLSDQLEKKTLELNALIDEKAAMQENISHLEYRCTVLKDKLSIAVRKGKGLAQEKENFKSILTERNSELEKLRSALQQNLSQYNASLDQITKLKHEVDLIPVLQKELDSARDHVDQIENYLSESKRALKSVLEAIESITIPNNLVIEEPAEKLRWISNYLDENEMAKMEAEEELRKVRDESNFLSGNLSSMQTITKSLEDALLVAENNQSILLNEKEQLQISKALLEKELREEKERAASHSSQLEAVSLNTRALEDDLLQARANISQLINDRDAAVESRSFAEEKLRKLEEEYSLHIIKLSDAGKTIETLENALSKAQNNIAILAEQNNEQEFASADLGREIQKLRAEVESNVRQMSESSSTIRLLVQGKKTNEQEISSLSSKLEACMEELASTRGSMENNSLDVPVILSHFQLLLKDQTLPSLISQYSERHMESLKNIDSLFKDIRDSFTEVEPDLESSLPVEDYFPPISASYPTSQVSSWNMESFENETGAIGDGNLSFQIEKINERLCEKRKMMADKFGNFSACIDESYASLLRRLHDTRDRIISIINYTKVLKQNMKDLDIDKQKQEKIIASVDSDNRILSSACADATERLFLSFSNSVPVLRAISELTGLEGNMSLDLQTMGQQASTAIVTNHVEAAEKLLIATRYNCDLIQPLKDSFHKMSEMTQDLQHRLEETRITFDKASKESESYKSKILELEGHLEAQQNMFSVQIDDYTEKVDELRKREADLSTSLSKFQEMHDPLLPASQLNAVLKKLNGIIVPPEYVNLGKDAYDSVDLRKLCYIIDSFNDYLHKVNSLSSENKELKSMVDDQIPEIESLRKQVDEQAENRVDTGEMNKFLEIESGLMRLVQKLGGIDLMDEKKVHDPIQLLSMLDQLVMAITLKSEILRSKNEELGAKLLSTPKDLDDSSNKVKLYESSNPVRTSQLEIVHERENSVASLPPQSEMQGMGAVNKVNSVPHVPSATHARTLRKDSSDHLAISIDSDGQPLINDKDPDEDKGHVFKSLITSGMIPRQGRAVADRIDGFWVSGSRALMKHPRGRLGLIAYMLAVHLWILGTLL